MNRDDLAKKYAYSPTSEFGKVIGQMIDDGLISVDPGPPPNSEEQEISERMVTVQLASVRLERFDQAASPSNFRLMTCVDRGNAFLCAQEIRKIIADHLTHLKAKWTAEGCSEGAKAERNRCCQLISDEWDGCSTDIAYARFTKLVNQIRDDKRPSVND